MSGQGEAAALHLGLSQLLPDLPLQLHPALGQVHHTGVRLEVSRVPGGHPCCATRVSVLLQKDAEAGVVS